MTKSHFSDSWYSISPKISKSHLVRKALHAKLNRNNTVSSARRFETKQEGLDALKAAGLSLDDYGVCKTWGSRIGL